MNNNHIYTEQELLSGLSKGEASAFTAVYNQYYPDLYFLSRRIAGDKAPDVVADVFAELWIRKKLFASGSHLLAYLRTMTRNACFDALKKQRRSDRHHQELQYVSEQEHEDHYFREIIEAKLFSLIREEISHLPPHIRKVFELAYIDGLSNAAIAQLLHMKDASVRVRKAEALQLLRSAMYDMELIALFHLMFLS